jgi:uncharacterized protein
MLAANRHDLRIPAEALSDFCRRHGIARLSFFGSVVRDDFLPDSDVDVLVEFADGRTPGLAFFAMQDELSQMLGRSVDLNTLGFLGDSIREEVLREAEVQYVAS